MGRVVTVKKEDVYPIVIKAGNRGFYKVRACVDIPAWTSDQYCKQFTTYAVYHVENASPSVSNLKKLYRNNVVLDVSAYINLDGMYTSVESCVFNALCNAGLLDYLENVDGELYIRGYKIIYTNINGNTLEIFTKLVGHIDLESSFIYGVSLYGKDIMYQLILLDTPLSSVLRSKLTINMENHNDNVFLQSKVSSLTLVKCDIETRSELYLSNSRGIVVSSNFEHNSINSIFNLTLGLSKVRLNDASLVGEYIIPNDKKKESIEYNINLLNNANERMSLSNCELFLSINRDVRRKESIEKEDIDTFNITSSLYLYKFNLRITKNTDTKTENKAHNVNLNDLKLQYPKYGIDRIARDPLLYKPDLVISLDNPNLTTIGSCYISSEDENVYLYRDLSLTCCSNEFVYYYIKGELTLVGRLTSGLGDTMKRFIPNIDILKEDKYGLIYKIENAIKKNIEHAYTYLSD